MANLLIVDDEPNIVADLAAFDRFLKRIEPVRLPVA